MNVPSILRAILACSLLTLLLTGCGLVGGDGDTTPEAGLTPTSSSSTGATSGVTVIDAAFGTAVDEERKVVGGATSVFSPDTKRVYAVLVLGNPQAGDVVTGRWYKLDSRSAPPDGAFINEAGVELTADTIGSNAIARVALNLTAEGDGLAEGEWLVRVYLNDDLIRTMAFVVTPRTLGPIPTSTAPPSPSGTPVGATDTPSPGPDASPTAEPTTAATATVETTPSPSPEPTPATTSYTVVSGDTLTLIAERVKPADESTESYVARLRQVNGLALDAILFVGQVLTLPPSQ